MSMEELSGQITRIIYRNAENGWTVLELTDESGEEIAATGTLPLCTPGEQVLLRGQYVQHKTYGRQFKAFECETVAPATLSALENYLGCGVIKGVGEATAKRITAMFGMDTLDMLEHHPERLSEVPGIGKMRAKMIAASYSEQRYMRDILMKLQGYGITVKQAMKFYNCYGVDCILRLEENPYQLIEDIEGVGFKTADKIALNMGVEHISSARLRAGMKYMLTWARQEGHTYLPRDVLLQSAAELLDVPKEPLCDVLDALILDGALHDALLDDVHAIYLPQLYYMESEAARKLLQLCRQPREALMIDIGQELMRLEKTLALTLSDDQRAAVTGALTEGAMVITGGPGTGKTTILQFILHTVTRLGLDFALCAPTGRAAKRMTEASGFDASTIHRLLEYGKDGQLHFGKNAEDQLFYDIVIVDEMSMVDLPLFNALLHALPQGTRLIMVGDADQLPPVGAGTVLHDIIKSETVPVIRLVNIYRQAGRSNIILNAHRINEGELPLCEPHSDFAFIPAAVPSPALELVLNISAGKDARYPVGDPFRDLQVLSPTRKGALGVKALNVKLQQELNPPEPGKAEHEYGDTIFREGDKVMQIKNNYRMGWSRLPQGGAPELGEGVYNGDLGTIYRIDKHEQTIEVLFDDERFALYSYMELEELELAYCISIHKSQGSEFPTVLLPLMYGPPMLMTRNLLYTAITRARGQVYILGDWGCVAQMVENKRMRKRYSALDVHLKNYSVLFSGGNDAN